MGAILKRRDSAGRVVSGFEPVSAVDIVNVSCTNFQGFLRLFTKRLVRYINRITVCTNYHGDDQITPSISYTAQVGIDRNKFTVYQESQICARTQTSIARAKPNGLNPSAIELANRESAFCYRVAKPGAALQSNAQRIA